MSQRPLTLMAVHAHPDDEATGTGGVLADAAARGIRTVLVTCTDGRCGDDVDKKKPGDAGHDPDAVVKAREAELRASCEILQVSHLEQLGYADSGMMGWATNDEPGSFWNTPVDEAAQRLAELMRQYQPDVVVTYDENGFYGHPDHIQAHRITMAAVAAVGGVPKLYWTTVPRSGFEEFGRVMREHGVEWDEPGEPSTEPEIGLPDDQVTTWVELTAVMPQKYDALAAHASQTENIIFLQLGLDQFTDLFGTETFVRVQDTTGAPLPENDLFAGLPGAPARR